MKISKWEDRPITKWEKVAIEAVEKAVKESHEKGISTVHGDALGIYELHPDGKKVYVELYKDSKNNGR